MNSLPEPSSSSTGDQHSRRVFLAATAGTAAAALLAGRVSASGADVKAAAATAAAPAPKAAPRAALADGQPINMGIIGVGGSGMGGMGRGHCKAFAEFNAKGAAKVNIAAICDINKLNLDEAIKTVTTAGQAATPEGYADHKQLLARPDIHGVLIAVPEHWHAQIAIDAILAGKDVYLEKPMTLNLADALRLREVVLANPDLRLQVGTQMTNLPKYHRAREVLAAGTIGTPTFSQVSYCRNSKDGEWNYYVLRPEWKPGDNLDWDKWCGPLGKMEWDPKVYSRWRRYRKTSTGICGDLLVHVITPMLVALGDHIGWPTRVVASGAHLVDKSMENFDTVNISVTFESGHLMFIAGSTNNEAGLETLIRGHKGNIYLGSRHCVVRPERIYAEDMDEKTIECADIGNDQDLHRLKWLEIIRTRSQPDSDVNQGAKVMVIVDLATRSMFEGGAFAFDPKSMTPSKLA